MKVGYKETVIGEIPDDWEVKPFEEVLVLQRGFDLPIQHRIAGSYPIIASNGKLDTHSEYRVKGPTIITGRSGTIGKVYFEQNECWPLNTTLYVKEMHGNNPRFLYYFLLNFKLEKFSTGTGVPTLNRNIIHSQKVCIPSSVNEQKKIAEILSTVDEKIEVINEEIAQTQELKKGLMQKLLTKGIGHTRFKPSPLGDIPESWEVVKVGDVIKLQGGFAFKSSDAQEEGVKWLKIANVSIGKIDWSDKSFLPLGFEKQYSSFVLKEGNIVIAMTRPLLGNLFKIAKIKKSDEGSLLNQRVGRVVCTEKIEKEFIYQVFNSTDFITKLQKELLGTDPPNISSFMFEGLEILLPPIFEQEKISEILSAVDDKLDILLEKKTHYQEFKKGLMQQLLTGKLRVNLFTPELA